MKKQKLETKGDVDGLISSEVSAQLLGIERREFDRLVRGNWIVPTTRNPQRFQTAVVVQSYLKYLQAEKSRGRTVAEVAQHLDISVKRVNELIDRNVIARKPRGEYNLDECRIAYCRSLSATAAGRGASGEGEATLAASRSRLAAARADEAEFRNSVNRGDYVSAAAVVRLLRDDFAIVRTLLLSWTGKLPSQLEGLTTVEMEIGFEREVYEILDTLANPETYVRGARDRKTRGRQFAQGAGGNDAPAVPEEKSV